MIDKFVAEEDARIRKAATFKLSKMVQGGVRTKDAETDEDRANALLGE